MVSRRSSLENVAIELETTAATASCTAKFQIAQIALCYEPDKRKILAIFECLIEKIRYISNTRRRLVPQYYVSFPGLDQKYCQWVDEDYILEDNDENRALKAKVNYKASSTRMSKGTKFQMDLTPVKKQYKSEEASYKVSDPIYIRTLIDPENEQFTEFPSPGSSSGYSEATLLPDVSTNDGSEAMLIMGTNSHNGRSFSLRIPQRIVNFLEYDCFMVTMKNKMHKLSQKPSVAKILQDYLLWFVGHYAFKKKADTYTLNTGEVFEVFDPLTSISLCKEILDGIRVYFDMALSSILLYKNETTSYFDAQMNSSSNKLLKEAENAKGKNIFPRRRRASLSPTFWAKREFSGYQSSENDITETEESIHVSKKQKLVRLMNEARTSQQLKTEPSLQLEHSRKVSKDANVCPASNEREFDSNSIINTNKDLQKAIHDAKKWSAIPDESLSESDPIPPCLIYGAPHLFRLFVEMPQMLADSEVTDARVKIILKHVSLFLEKYVVNESQLFNVNIYKK